MLTINVDSAMLPTQLLGKYWQTKLPTKCSSRWAMFGL